MAVIKSQFAGSFVKDAIVLDMGDLRRQGDQLREAAKAQADGLVAEAKVKAAELAKTAENEAKTRGFEQGMAQGLEQGRKTGHAEALNKMQAQLNQIQQGWLGAAQAWNDQRAQMDREARQAVLQLGLLFAEKVVQRVIQVDPMVIVDQLAESLAYVMRPTDVTVHINPEDRPALEESMPQLIAGLPHLLHVRLVDDATVARGGCTIQYGQGRIDATVHTQMQRLVELMIPSDETHGDANGSQTLETLANANELPPASTDASPEQA